MIRFFLILLASMALTWYVADAIRENGPGYVYIYFNQYTVETSFWFFLVLLVVLVGGLHLVFWLIPYFFRLLKRVGLIPRRYTLGKARRLQQQGVIAYLNRHWSLASNQLEKAASKGDEAFMDLLMAARASLEQGDQHRAKELGGQAGKCIDADELSMLLLRIDIAAVSGDLQGQEKLLQKAMREFPESATILERAIAFYKAGEHWSTLHTLLPKIRKKQVLKGRPLVSLQVDIVCGLLKETGTDLQHGKKIWKQYPAAHEDANACYYYAGLLQRYEQFQDAEKFLRKQLSSSWHDSLALAYASMDSADVDKRIRFMEGLLESQGHNPVLLQSLANLYLLSENLEEAEKYIMQALDIRDDINAYRIQARLFLRKGDQQKGIDAMQKALEKAGGI